MLHATTTTSRQPTTRSGIDRGTRRRVLFVSGDYLGYAGCAQRFRRYFPGMLARGVQPEVLALTPLAKKHWGNGLDLEAREDPPGVPVRVLQAGGEGKRRRRRRLFRSTLMDVWKRRDLDLVHVLQQLPARAKNLPMALALRLSPMPKVLSVTMDFSVKPSRTSRWIQRLHYSAFDLLLCQSEEQVLRFEELGVRGDVELIPNGVDTALYRPVHEAARCQERRRLGLPVEGPLFLYVGSIQPRKGTGLLLEAWRDHKAAGGEGHLVLVGPRFDGDRPGWSRFSERVDQLLEEPIVRESTTITGVLPSALEHLRAADAFVFPSESEGVPNAVLEAMSCGLPCILTPFYGASRQLGRPDQEFLTCGPSVSALRVRLAEVARDPASVRNRQGRAARKWMLDHMDLERSVQEHCDLYAGLIERGRP